ncbi:hypothetical protein SSBR45G_46660 [Bradyrhizobium sp. SSBR45G]|uniref:hypothetical protein n=1 Tax=unclassified Bradyrhizobium TaxID=2631580 RepID=UPI002342A3C3|nr:MULTISPECIES: hypothetical protein [unclassified Bradyrhizobium]GLH79757.1 hypothetical protein SSBR45G_46660 [Bradyrhizobium sp. SSBR45G]GLH87125.1 hypothetical protein SSBR45R_45850 [Bradyrhizobium sp. SSBR45R]
MLTQTTQTSFDFTFAPPAGVRSVSATRRKTSTKRRFTDAELRAAVSRFGDDDELIASHLRTSVTDVHRRRKKLGIAKVTWTLEARRRLFLMATRTPRPTNAEIAREFGCSVGAIETALSRHNISRGGVSAGPAKPRNLSAKVEKRCMRCKGPFVPAHRHNYMCNGCRAEVANMAA